MTRNVVSREHPRRNPCRTPQLTGRRHFLCHLPDAILSRTIISDTPVMTPLTKTSRPTLVLHIWMWSAAIIGFAIGSILGERVRPAAIWFLLSGALAHACCMWTIKKQT